MHQDTYLDIHRYHQLMCLNLSSLSSQICYSSIVPYLSLWHLHPLKSPSQKSEPVLISSQCTFNLLPILLLLFQIQFLHNIHTDQRACTFRPYTFPWVSARDKAEEPSTFPPFSFPTYLHLKYI